MELWLDAASVRHGTHESHPADGVLLAAGDAIPEWVDSPLLLVRMVEFWMHRQIQWVYMLMLTIPKVRMLQNRWLGWFLGLSSPLAIGK